MVDMLEEVMRSGTAAGVRTRGFLDAAAGKTGTSRDGWFAGFTSELLCVVWVGFDDNRELGLEGARSALLVWTEFMKQAGLRSRYEPGALAAPPAGVVQGAVDLETGMAAGPNCPNRMWSYFLAGQAPTAVCTRHDGSEPLQFGPVLDPLAVETAPDAVHPEVHAKEAVRVR